MCTENVSWSKFSNFWLQQCSGRNFSRIRSDDMNHWRSLEDQFCSDAWIRTHRQINSTMQHKLKGKIHTKKENSVIIYFPSSWWKVRWRFVAHKTFQSILLHWNRWRLVLKHLWKMEDKIQNGSYRLVGIIQVSKSPKMMETWRNLSNSESFNLDGCKYFFFKYVWDPRASRDFSPSVPIYLSCPGECCNTVLLWSSRNILWTTKLHLTFHIRHKSEQVTLPVCRNGASDSSDSSLP